MPQFLPAPTDNARHFRVALVEEAALPQGGEGDNWCRYVIENAHATMTGWRRGSLQDVTHYAREYTEALNTHRTPSASRWTGAHGRRPANAKDQDPTACTGDRP